MGPANNLSKIFKEIWRSIENEKSFYYTSICYGIGVSLLSLAIPISVQSLINSVTVGVLIQPLVVISIALLTLLIFSKVLSTLQVYTIEIFQRYLYSRVSLRIAYNFLNSKIGYFRKMNPEKMINKYFDIMTVQKSMVKILVEGFTLVLQTLVGLILLSFYHPYFLAFNAVLIFLLYLAWKIFALRAFHSSVAESNSKYETAQWLQEVARNLNFFQSQEEKKHAYDKSEFFVNQYLVNRSKHFRKVFSQTIFLYIIYALMSASVLGLGGFLVIKGQLTVGQLVAAEIVIATILSSLSKAGKHLESVYDLYAAIKKLDYFFKIDLSEKKLSDQNVEKSCLKISAFDQNDLMPFDLDYHFHQGKIYRIHVSVDEYKYLFLEFMKAELSNYTGKMFLGGVSYEDISREQWRHLVRVVDKSVIVEGSLEYNLKLSRDIKDSAINEIIQVVDLDRAIEILPQRKAQMIHAHGAPLRTLDVIKLNIARAILFEPKILILADSFDQLPHPTREKILRHLKEKQITTLLLGHEEFQCQHIHEYLDLNESGFTNL